MSDRWRRSLLGYSVKQFERARRNLHARHKMQTARLEAELAKLRSEELELKSRLTDLQNALQTAEREQERRMQQSLIHAVPPPSQGWLHLRRRDDDRVADEETTGTAAQDAE